MNIKKWYAIGVMSGTSLDGVDIAYVEFTNHLEINKWDFEIIHAATFAYSKDWLNKLNDAFYYDENALKEVDVEYGLYLGKLIINFIKANTIENIDFIASHGHTIHHQPEKGYTLQIGDGDVIFQNTNVKTIYDFRSQDVSLGGQGAPLVPIGDALLFNDYKYCLNLGGFANISFENNNKRLAFDICAVNTVLNHFANKLDMDYDDKGKIAASGKLHNELLTQLNNLDFYQMEKPKSLGVEFVNNIVLPLINSFSLKTKDVLHTYVEHIAMQISKSLSSEGTLLVTGGGAFNTYLIQRIDSLSINKISIPDKTIIDYKEALIFAFLGVLRLDNKINCLKSVTGATKDHSSGIIVG